MLLHALTSHVLPDPFTSLSGTEQALLELRAAALWSYASLEPEVNMLLEDIKRLSPKRQFYPIHQKTMECVEWHEVLSPLAQHEDFAELADAIVSHGNRFVALYPSNRPTELSVKSNEELCRRAKSQHRMYYPNSTIDVDRSPCDKLYNSRGHKSAENSHIESLKLVRLIRDWPRSMKLTSNLYDRLRAWGIVASFGKDFSSRDVVETLALPLKENWGSLLKLCLESVQNVDTFRLSFLFATIAFGQPHLGADLKMLLIFAFRSNELRGLAAGLDGVYQLSEGSEPNISQIQGLLKCHQRPYEGKGHSTHDKIAQKEARVYRVQVEKQMMLVSETVVRGWPDFHISTKLDEEQITRYEFMEFLPQLELLYNIWLKNRSFWEFCQGVAAAVEAMDEQVADVQQSRTFIVTKEVNRYKVSFDTYTPLWSRLQSLAAPAMTSPEENDRGAICLLNNDKSTTEARSEIIELSGIIQEHGDVSHHSRKAYAADLMTSVQALAEGSSTGLTGGLSAHDFSFARNRFAQKEALAFNRIKSAFLPSTSFERVISAAGFWPTLTPRCLFQLLSHAYVDRLPRLWKTAIIFYGQHVLVHQRSCRALRHYQVKDMLSFQRESTSVVADSDFYEEYPDWLLIQLEQDILMTQTQVEVAKEMMEPSTGKSSCIQLGMGQGKTSMIIPAVSAHLADGNRLVRVFTLKPLARQLEHILTERLGGLVNRRVYMTPFHRKTPLTTGLVEKLPLIFQECQNYRGVFLTQPEHMLSYQLRGIDRLYAGDTRLAPGLLDGHAWLRGNSRDLLDEADELLNVSFGLVYTAGSQANVEGQPDRWLVVQSVFTLIAKHAPAFVEDYPTGLEYIVSEEGSFGTLRILDASVGCKLLAAVIHDIGSGLLHGISFDHCPEPVRLACVDFIS